MSEPRRKRTRRFVRWVVLFLVGAPLLGVTTSQPVQFAMAATNPKPAVHPVLDTSGIIIIQEILLGESELYRPKEVIDKIVEEFGAEAQYLINVIPMELILNSIKNLAIMQMDLTEFVTIDPDTGAVILEGDFGRVLQEILGADPKRDFSMAVEHTDFIQRPSSKEDCYRLKNSRYIDVILKDTFAGYEWGVMGLVLREDKLSQQGTIYTEEKELLIKQVEDAQNPGQYIFGATYMVRIRAPDGRLVSLEQWNFVQGNPNAVFHDKQIIQP